MLEVVSCILLVSSDWELLGVYYIYFGRQGTDTAGHWLGTLCQWRVTVGYCNRQNHNSQTVIRYWHAVSRSELTIIHSVHEHIKLIEY